MSPDDLAFESISNLSRFISKKEVSPVDLIDTVMKRIERFNPSLNAYLTVLGQSRDEARQRQEEIAQGKHRGPLHGIPVSLKDLILTKGIHTTCGSKILRDYVPDEDAAIVQKLRDAGAVIVGKTNLHEFAFGVTSNNPHFGPVRNPWNLECIPGGSSGGSGAAVAAGLGCMSIGSDTRGSIRIPAAACGVVGLKPTYGLVSMYGVVPLSWSLDHVGPLTRTVEDAALVLAAIAGYDGRDPASAEHGPVDYRKSVDRKAEGLRIGICRTCFFERIDPEIERAVEGAVTVLRDAGMRVWDVTIPHIEQALEISTRIQRPEATAYHQEYLRTRAGDYSAEVKQKLETGWAISAVDYINATRTRQALKNEFKRLFNEIDCLLAPTLPALPPPIGQGFVAIEGDREDVGQAYVRLNAPQNLTGFPALSLPCGFGSNGLPIGLQLIAAEFREEALFTVGAEYQRRTEWHLRRPAIVSQPSPAPR